MIKAGVLSFHFPGSILFSSYSPLVFTWPSFKIIRQKNMKMFSMRNRTILVLVLRRLKQASCPSYRHFECATTGRNQYHGHLSDDGFDQESSWFAMVKDIIRSLRSLVLFLVEQPNQLKYIEWPSFFSTVRTASLTLVLVALLIVSLASVDSFFCYILALLVRKSAS